MVQKIICIITLVIAALIVSAASSASAATKKTPNYLRYTSSTYKQIQADLKKSSAKGNNRYSFIKVGDSNTANHYSLYGLGCYRYSPVGVRSSLASVIYKYRQVKLPVGDPASISQTCNTGSTANSFSRASMAAQGGATAAFALTPSASSAPCTDIALVCELKTVKPRYAFIQFGTNEAREAAGPVMSASELNTFKQQITQIVTISRAYGTTPVLVTAPVALDGTTGMPNANGGQRIIQINTVIRSVSKANKTPMIDLWYAQKQMIGSLNHFGLKNDGIHLATSPNPDPWVGSVNLSEQNRQKYGMNLRNYLIIDSLERLDKIPAKQ